MEPRAALLAAAVSLAAFFPAHGGFTRSDNLDATSLGKTLANHTVYVVSQDTTLERPANSSESALYVASGATSVIYIPKNVTLTVKGGNAQGTHGAGAGIAVPTSSTLIVTGGGKIVAQGGNAANGAGGGNGGNGVIIDDNDSYYDEWGHAGAGGDGGDGGGGAAAGIGGAGGNGGNGGGGGGWTWYDTDDNFNHYGDDGDDGSDGSGSYTGNIYFLGSISAKATGGSRADSGGSSGSAGSIRVEHWFMGLSYRACGGGGGGGGAGGSWAYDYGVGGYGGGGGGGGGGGATYQVIQGMDDDNSRGGYGGGGQGGVKGYGTQSGGVTHWGVTGGGGGNGGNAGSNASGGGVYRDFGVSLEGSASSLQYATTHAAIAYVLTISDDWRTNEVHAVKLGYEMPATAPVMSRENYTFLGWFDSKNGLGTKYYDVDGTCLVPTYAYVGDLTLYAGWQINDATAAAVTVNGTGIVGGVSLSGDGWMYDGETGLLRFTSMLQPYAISGISTNGEVRIKADCDATFTLDGLVLDTSKIGGRIPFQVGNGYHPTIEVVGASRFVGGENAPGISVGDLATLDIRGESSLLVQGGPGAADIGPNGSVSLAKVVVDTKGPDVHPARFKLASDFGWECEFESKATGERVWCVKVPGGFAQGAAVAWADLSEDYLPKNTIGDEDGNAYLWLPEGMHVFSSLTASGEKDWVAWVERAHATAQPFASRGVTVNGTDVAYLKGDGWTFDNTNMVYLTSSGPYVLSGQTVSDLMPVSVNVTADSSIILSNLTLTASSNDVDKWAAVQLLSGVSANIFIAGTNSLYGSGVCAAVSVPENSTATFRGNGHLTVKGASGSPGIGSSRNAAFGTVNIAGATIHAMGGSFAPGIGTGDGESSSGDFLGGSVVISGGTVHSERDTWNSLNSQADIGSSDYGVCGSVIISGGSVKGYGAVADWKVRPDATNSQGVAVFPVTVPGLEANASASMTWLTTAGASLGYGMDGVHADEGGKIYLWLPNGTYYFTVNGQSYRALVSGGAAEAQPWESCVFVDGVDVCAGSGAGWTYMDRTVSFGDGGRTYIVTGTNTADEVKFSAVDGVTLCLTNLSVAATNVLTVGGAVKVIAPGPSRLAATGEKLILGTGSVEILDGTLDLTGGTSASVVVSGGSVKYSGTASPYFKNSGGDRVWCVTVDELAPGAKVGGVTPWASGSFPSYGSDGIYADAEGKIYLWLPNGAYDFVVSKEESGEEQEYVVFVLDGNASARQYEPYGFFVDSVDVGHYKGEGWYVNDKNKYVALAETRDFVLNGTMEYRLGVMALVDACATLSNATVTIHSKVDYLSALATANGVDLDIVLVGTNSVRSGNYAAGVCSSEGATVRLRGEGSLYAKGGGGSAGIGSGENQRCGRVIIEGGRIRAEGGRLAPGIGVGDAFYSNTDLGGIYEISGGVVEVSGTPNSSYNYPADIGASDCGSCGSITISGGTVSGFGGASLSFVGNGRKGKAQSVRIVGGSVNVPVDKVVPSAKDAGDENVYPVVVGGLAAGAKVQGFAFQHGYGSNDIYADGGCCIYLWLNGGWNYFLVEGVPYRVNVQSVSGTAAQWLSGVYVDGIDAAYVTYGAWKLVDTFIDLTNSVSYVVNGGTQEMSLRASANLSAIVSNLTVNVSSISDAYAFIVSGTSASMVLEGTNTFNAGKNKAGVAVPSGATLAISGDGVLNAIGGYEGAGIGSGREGSMGQLSITGGAIAATGGHSAPGVGIGWYGDGGSINISGGTITATGGDRAAGIGGGFEARNFTVTIIGGDITALGGKNAPGIGAGESQTMDSQLSGTVTISGGIVRATGYDNAAAIGASHYASMGAIRIDGGTVFPLTASGEEGRIGASRYSTVTSVKFTGGAIYTTTNNVNPAAINHLGANVFPLDLDLETPEEKVANVVFGHSSFSYYGKKDIYTNADGILRVWVPPTNGKPLPINVTMENGEAFVFCVLVDDDGSVTQVDFLAVNGTIVTSSESSSGDGWSYRTDTKVLTLTGDAQLDGVSTNGLFHVLVPEGGAENVVLHRLALTARSQKKSSAIVIQNDVVMTISRSNTVTAVSQYAVGIEVAKDASLVLSGDGKLVVRGGNDAAGIGSNGLKISADEPGVPGMITVESGEITAYGGANAAGIGGGRDNNLQQDGITIVGGIVRAYGGINAPGIGAGNGRVKIPDGAVVVEGGTVLAWGGDNPRQPGGFGGSKSQSDVIMGLGNVRDPSSPDEKQLVVLGGTIVPETQAIDIVAPRPVDASGAQLYSVTFINLAANSPVDLSCEDFPSGFGLNDIYSDDAGRVSIWLAPTNRTRVVSVNGKYFTTDYPEDNSAQNLVYEADVVVDCGTGGSDEPPESVDAAGGKLWRVTVPGLEPNAPVMLDLTEEYRTVTGNADAGVSFYFYIADGQYTFKANDNDYAVDVDGKDALATAISREANPSVESIEIDSGVVIITVSSDNPYADWTTMKIYCSSTLPVTEASEQVDLTTYVPVDNGDGTMTITIPLSDSESQVFFMVL